MQGSILGEGNGDNEDGVIDIGDGGGVAVSGGGGRRSGRILSLHGEIKKLECESNGESEFGGGAEFSGGW
ncbi:hypothetical protein PIB30_054960, partial [Stylosanthes scabra]|nr:hypothetical protein [Stylosanthes scabra]